jgi:hypothetical protein
LLVAWAFIAVMITVALIDHDHMIIPDKIVLPGALLGLGAAIAVDPQGWWTYLAGSLGAATFMFLLVMLWPGGMGPGDVKMALLMGAELGASVTGRTHSRLLRVGPRQGVPAGNPAPHPKRPDTVRSLSGSRRYRSGPGRSERATVLYRPFQLVASIHVPRPAPMVQFGCRGQDREHYVRRRGGVRAWL